MDDALRAELEAMREADQAIRVEARATWEKHGPDAPEYAALRTRGRAQDARHVARLDEIVAVHGWPGRSLVGDAACGGAFLIVQHADLEVQKRYLPLMREAHDAGELKGQDLALLEDRIFMQEGQPQRYGSQLTRGEDGKPTLWPIEDEAHLDERRAEMGLEPLADYLRRFGLEDPRNTT